MILLCVAEISYGWPVMFWRKIAERPPGRYGKGAETDYEGCAKASLDGSRSFRVEVLSILESDGRLSSPEGIR